MAVSVMRQRMGHENKWGQCECLRRMMMPRQWFRAGRLCYRRGPGLLRVVTFGP